MSWRMELERALRMAKKSLDRWKCPSFTGRCWSICWCGARMSFEPIPFQSRSFRSASWPRLALLCGPCLRLDTQIMSVKGDVFLGIAVLIHCRPYSKAVRVKVLAASWRTGLVTSAHLLRPSYARKRGITLLQANSCGGEELIGLLSLSLAMKNKRP